MSALDKIAELHRSSGITSSICVACGQPWPCPTRRLLDEANNPHLYDHVPTYARIVTARDAAEAERDAARADAERLAAALREVRARMSCIDPADDEDVEDLNAALSVTKAALAAHDALTGTHE